MSRFAIVLGLSAIFLGQSIFAASTIESSDEVEKMQVMLKNVESIFGNTAKANNDDVKAYERFLRDSLKASLALARAYNFSISDLALREVLERPLRKVDDKVEFAGEIPDEFATED